MSIISMPSSSAAVTTTYVLPSIVVIALPFAASRHFSPFATVHTSVSVPSATLPTDVGLVGSEMSIISMPLSILDDTTAYVLPAIVVIAISIGPSNNVSPSSSLSIWAIGVISSVTA